MTLIECSIFTSNKIELSKFSFSLYGFIQLKQGHYKYLAFYFTDSVMYSSIIYSFPLDIAYMKKLCPNVSTVISPPDGAVQKVMTNQIFPLSCCYTSQVSVS